MKLKKIHPKIYSVEFDKTTTMCNTLLRFSEYYENPFFKKRLFTKDEFKAWFKNHFKTKRFTYSLKWDGYNITGEDIIFFKNKEIDELETKFINLFKGINLRNKYIVCYAKDSNPTTLKHEMIHAYYTVNKQYKRKVNHILYKELNRNERIAKNKVFKWFKNMGYDKTVFYDEFNAYITEDYRYIEKQTGIKKNTFLALSLDLNWVYLFRDDK